MMDIAARGNGNNRHSEGSGMSRIHCSTNLKSGDSSCRDRHCLRLVLALELGLAPKEFAGNTSSLPASLECQSHDGAVAAILPQAEHRTCPPAVVAEWEPRRAPFREHPLRRAPRFDCRRHPCVNHHPKITPRYHLKSPLPGCYSSKRHHRSARRFDSSLCCYRWFIIALEHNFGSVHHLAKCCLTGLPA